MIVEGINLLPILPAVILSMMIGAVWYSLFAKPWMASTGLTENDIRPKDANGAAIKQSPMPYIVAFIAQLVLALTLAGLMEHIGEITILNGIITSLFAWAGFVVAPMAVNHRFQMKPWLLTIIDAGHWLIVFLAQGITIGALGSGPINLV